MKKWLFALVSILVVSCDFKPGDIETPEWNLDMFGPLAKSDLTVEEILQIQTVTFVKALTTTDVGLKPPGTYPSLPADFVPLAGPHLYTLSDSFIDLKVLTGSYTIKVENNLPFPIKSGVKVFATDTTNTDTIFKFHLTKNLLSGQSFVANPISIAGKIVPNRVNFWVQDVGMDAVTSPVTISASTNVKVSFTLDNFTIDYVRISPSNQITFADTVAMSTEGQVIKSDAASGIIKMYVRNGMPIQMDVQAYLLDGEKMLIDSFWTERVIIPPAKASATTYTATTPDSVLFQFSLDSDKITSLNKAKYIYPKAVFRSMNPTYPYVKITKNDFISVQAVGDIQLRVNGK